MDIFAHRGDSGNAPENTIAAFKLALENKNLYGIELDVHLTKDNVIVVCHDESIDRTTNGSGDIVNMTYSELKNFDAGSWFGEKFKGERIPTLEEVLDLVPRDVMLNIEIKDGGGKGIENYLVKLLREKDRVDSVLISSFTHRLLRRVSQIEPSLKIGLLFSADIIDLGKYIDSLNMKIYSYNPEQGFLSSESVKDCLDRNIKIVPWTVNKNSDYKRLEKLGATGVFTNYPSTIMNS